MSRTANKLLIADDGELFIPSIVQPIKPIALRLTDKAMSKRVKKLSDQHGLSLSMTVNMLLGYAFNKVDEEGKEFTPVVVFESKDEATL